MRWHIGGSAYLGVDVILWLHLEASVGEGLLEGNTLNQLRVLMYKKVNRKSELIKEQATWNESIKASHRPQWSAPPK